MQINRTSNNVPLTDEEREEIKIAAAKEGIPMATFMRWASLKAARKDVYKNELADAADLAAERLGLTTTAYTRMALIERMARDGIHPEQPKVD